MVRITLENCLEKLREIGISPNLMGELIRLETPKESRLNLALWGILDVDKYEFLRIAFIPTRAYFHKYVGGDNNSFSPIFMKTYDSMVRILEEESFQLRYITDVKEI